MDPFADYLFPSNSFRYHDITMESVLSKNYIGEFSMTVGNLSCSTRARPRSKLGLEMIEKSVKAKGWLSQFSPSVLIACEHVPDGIVTPELALSLKARVLDGNHRVVVFTKLFGGSATLKVRLYYNFVNGPNESVIANCEFYCSAVSYCVGAFFLSAISI